MTRLVHEGNDAAVVLSSLFKAAQSRFTHARTTASSPAEVCTAGRGGVEPTAPRTPSPSPANPKNERPPPTEADGGRSTHSRNSVPVDRLRVRRPAIHEPADDRERVGRRDLGRCLAGRDGNVHAARGGRRRREGNYAERGATNAHA